MQTSSNITAAWSSPPAPAATMSGMRCSSLGCAAAAPGKVAFHFESFQYLDLDVLPRRSSATLRGASTRDEDEEDEDEDTDEDDEEEEEEEGAAHTLSESSSWSLVARTASRSASSNAYPAACSLATGGACQLPIRTRMLWNDTPLPRISTPSLRRGASLSPMEKCRDGSSEWCSDKHTTGTSAAGKANRSGTKTLWSNPRSSSSFTRTTCRLRLSSSSSSSSSLLLFC